MQYETITMPDAGIGSFLTSNMDEIDDNVLMFGHGGGINSMKEVADRMAKMGREGDTFVVHASEKEVMVPREVAENNPQLLAQIKDAIAAEGADPEAYVVGSDRNSINPMTGQREFFLKKLVKGIKKVFKKAAKIIIPVGLNYFFPGMGAIASGAIGAGIGGLIQGESFGDALKSAALGGITAGIASGVSGALGSIGTEQTLGQGFMTGLKGALPSQDVGFFTNRFKIENAPGFLDPLGTGRAMDAGFEPLMPKTAPVTNTDIATQMNEIMKNNPSIGDDVAYKMVTDANALKAAGGSSVLGTAVKYGLPSLLAAGAAGAFDPIPTEEITQVGGLDVTDQTSAANPIASTTSVLDANEGAYRVGVPSAPTFFDLNQIMVPSAALYGPSQGTIANLYANLTPVGAGTNVITPSATASGEAPAETEVAEVVIPGYDPTVTGMRPAPLYGVDAQGNPVFTPYYSDPILPAAYAASGGAMNFPRRTGQIEGPGTETSDDIPAMLSDGEFVMTAKAVKGAGNGSREQGFRKMYDIMRSFEGGAVA
tara:strand:+ start:880 stop:2499 length:1620 start_codon:yes stop_codon:yes gene_type:complete